MITEIEHLIDKLGFTGWQLLAAFVVIAICVTALFGGGWPWQNLGLIIHKHEHNHNCNCPGNHGEDDDENED